MTLPISEVVNVKLSKVPTAEAQRNFGMLALLSSEYLTSSVKDEPYVIVASQDDVELAFGTNSKTAAACRPFMGHSPRPATMVIGPIDSTLKPVTPATKATLSSATTISLTDVEALGTGTLSMLINGTAEVFILDFTKVTTIDQLVTELDTKLAAKVKVTKSATGVGVVLTALTAGVGSIEAIRADTAQTEKRFTTRFSSAFLTDAVASDASAVLKLRTEDGATKVDGKAASAAGAPMQTEIEAIAAFSNEYPEWYAVAFVNNFTSNEAIFDTGVYIQALDKRIMAFTTNSSDHLQQLNTNPIKKLYDALADRTCVFYHKVEKHPHMAALAEMLSVNFEGTKTVKTLKFKQASGIMSDSLDVTTAKKAFALGINCYTYYGSSAMFSEGTMIGKHRYFDEIHWLDWLVDAVQKNVFNALLQTPTQIDLTDQGTAKLLKRVTEVAGKGVRNGGAAPGVWRIDGFGTLSRGDFLEEGFYAWADTVANLSDTQVEDRQGPTMYLAIKRAGAVHKSEVIIGFSR